MWKSNLNDIGFLIKLWRPKASGKSFQMKKEKNSQLRILHTVKISFRNEGKIKAYLDERKPREFVASKLSLIEWLKNIF